MSIGALNRIAACNRVIPLSSELEEMAFASFRKKVGLERTADRKNSQS